MFGIGIVGPYVHKGGNVTPALSDCITLEQLTHLIEQHHGDGFVVVATAVIYSQGKGTHRRNKHKEVFVQHASVENSQCSLPQDVMAGNEIND